jgi:hypothetical protein
MAPGCKAQAWPQAGQERFHRVEASRFPDTRYADFHVVGRWSRSADSDRAARFCDDCTVKHRNVRVREWDRYVQRIPQDSKTPPGYLRQTHPDARFAVVLLDGSPVQPAADAALAEARATGEPLRGFPVSFVAPLQGRRVSRSAGLKPHWVTRVG